MSMYDEELGYRRGFGRYLDKDMAEQAHTAAEAERERAQRGRGTVADQGQPTDDSEPIAEHRPPPRGRSVFRGGRDGRGFGRYLTD
ncbi:hypothetical protein [Gordonia aichiensis]